MAAPVERNGTLAEDEVSSTIVQVIQPEEAEKTEEAPVLRLRLEKPKSDKKVAWREDTVDNEGMNKKKSKCCCVYQKPLKFGESSSETDDECENCFGHVEKKKKNRKKRNGNPTQDDPGIDESDHGACGSDKPITS